jgi:hypothetical protein
MRIPGFRRAKPTKFSDDKEHAGRAGAPKSDSRVSNVSAGDPYAADHPWQPGDPDQLGRAGFARRIAQSIIDHPTDAGLVVGVYGPWGEGKTSLLHMVDAELKRSREIETLWFNPWYFRGQEALVLSFLSQLAAKLEVRLGTSSDEFKRLLNKYGSVLSALPLSVYGVDPGKLMTAVADRLKESDLEALKDRLNKILDEKRIDLVVFMDDIDRLDRGEIHSVLKLVKLAAGFRHVTYVLSFDDEMVAAAVGEAYGGDATAGRSFLEKIVQVPLRLPRVEDTTLLQLALGEVDRALMHARCEVATEQVHEFRRYFDPLFEARPRTLRAGKRYGNSLSFALPLLEGEVRIADLLLLEAVRAFAPSVYSSIPARRDLLIGHGHDNGGRSAQKEKDEAVAAWNALLSPAEPSERRALADLLQHLFPRVGRFTQNMHYGSDWDTRWAKEQRVASTDYFDRFFQYSVPPNDVSDVGVRELMEVLGSGDVDAATGQYDTLLSPANAKRLVFKLRLQEDHLSPVAAKALIRVLLRRGGALPRPRSFFGFDAPQAQAIILLTQALRRVPLDERFAIAEEVLSEPTTLTFAAECFQRIRHRPSDGEGDRARTVTAEEEARLQDILRRRLSAAGAVSPVYLEGGEGTQLLLHMWATFAGRDETEVVLKSRFIAEPAEAARLIAAFASQAWDMSTGLPLPKEIDRNQYDALARLIDPALVVEALQTAYGEMMATGTGTQDEGTESESDIPDDIRLARRFAFLHQIATQAATTGPGVDEHVLNVPASMSASTAASVPDNGPQPPAGAEEPSG